MKSKNLIAVGLIALLLIGGIIVVTCKLHCPNVGCSDRELGNYTCGLSDCARQKNSDANEGQVSESVKCDC